MGGGLSNFNDLNIISMILIASLISIYSFIYSRIIYGAPSIRWTMSLCNDVKKAQCLSSGSESCSEGHRGEKIPVLQYFSEEPLLEESPGNMEAREGALSLASSKWCEESFQMEAALRTETRSGRAWWEGWETPGALGEHECFKEAGGLGASRGAGKLGPSHETARELGSSC